MPSLSRLKDRIRPRRQWLLLGIGAVAALATAGDQALADQQVSRAELKRAGADLQRLEFLVRQGGISLQEVDKARAAYRQAQGQVTRSQASALQARVSAEQTLAQQGEDALADARLQLSYTRILAPAAGRIGSRSAEPGQRVQLGQPLRS